MSDSSPSETSSTLRDAETAPGTPVIGLTGVVAAGKSTAARLLAAEGCHVIDVDALGHQVLARPDVIARVRELFGAAVARADGTLDHDAIAARVFDDPAALAELEALVHPHVRDELSEALEHALGGSPRAIVIDAALLFEGGLDELCDETVCVTADAARRRERARTGRGWDDDEVSRREARQMTDDEKRSRATRLLANDGDVASLRRAVNELLRDLAPVSAPAARKTARGAAEDER